MARAMAFVLIALIGLTAVKANFDQEELQELVLTQGGTATSNCDPDTLALCQANCQGSIQNHGQEDLQVHRYTYHTFNMSLEEINEHSPHGANMFMKQDGIKSLPDGGAEVTCVHLCDACPAWNALPDGIFHSKLRHVGTPTTAKVEKQELDKDEGIALKNPTLKSDPDAPVPTDHPAGEPSSGPVAPLEADRLSDHYWSHGMLRWRGPSASTGRGSSSSSAVSGRGTDPDATVVSVPAGDDLTLVPTGPVPSLTVDAGDALTLAPTGPVPSLTVDAGDALTLVPTGPVPSLTVDAGDALTLVPTGPVPSLTVDAGEALTLVPTGPRNHVATADNSEGPHDQIAMASHDSQGLGEVFTGEHCNKTSGLPFEKICVKDPAVIDPKQGWHYGRLFCYGQSERARIESDLWNKRGKAIGKRPAKGNRISKTQIGDCRMAK